VTKGRYKVGVSQDASLLNVLHPDLFDFLKDAKGMNPGTSRCLKSSEPHIDQPATSERPANMEQSLMEYYARVRRENTDRALAMTAAISRQGIFASKMSHMLWLRSPSVKLTLTRAITRYRNFSQLFEWHPTKRVLPALDIDLVWKTHKLDAKDYQKFSKEKKLERFITHDENLDTANHDDLYAETSAIYYKEYLEPYQMCMCWDCEAIRDAVTNTRPKSDEELRTLVEDVQKKVKIYRAAEMMRRREAQQA
jgi:hypothetical protein